MTDGKWFIGGGIGRGISDTGMNKHRPNARATANANARANANANATANANANTGILRFAQDDDVKTNNSNSN